jgi:hypothetical protein
MKIQRLLDSRVGSLAMATFMLVGLASPAFLTSPVSADQVTDRQIQMSSTSPSATNVSYAVTFTPKASGTTVVVEFCAASPVITEACTAPAGFSTASATATGGTIAAGFSGSTASVKVTPTAALVADTPKSFTITNVTNPNTVTTFYARIITYTDATQSNGHTALGTYGTHVDDGGIALHTTNPFQVSAVIRETMNFCVSDGAAADPAAGCTSLTTPSVVLGHGSPAALDASATDTDSVTTQLSTNASSGAIVYLKNNNICGGLFRAGATAGTCDIPPVGSSTDAIAFGTAKFGMKVSGLGNASGGSTPTGTLVAETNYGGSNYGMNWSGNSTGVSSTYGDAIYNSANAPVSNKNIDLTFAATASPNTPAGSYSATMNLIAVGKF